MRAMDSNLRGLRSASGILIWNSRSSSPTISGSAKESRNPESNSDSSASGTESFFETFLRMVMIRALLSIGCVGASREKSLVLRHQFVGQHVSHQAITSPCEVHIVGLAQTGLHPLANGSGSTHAGSPVPKCATVFKRHLALDLDHFVQVRERQPAASGPEFAIGRPDDKDARYRRIGAQPANHFGERVAIFGFGPRSAERFVGPVSHHDQRGIARR